MNIDNCTGESVVICRNEVLIEQLLKTLQRIVAQSSEAIAAVEGDRLHSLRTLPKNGNYDMRLLAGIAMHVVHHSATKPEVTPQAIANYHVTEKEWPGIGYHFVISPDGIVYQTNPIYVSSYHAGSYNKTSIGTCLVGDFTQYAPTDDQIASLSWLHNQYLPYVLGKPLPLKGHKELMTTSCPGDKWDWHQCELS